MKIKYIAIVIFFLTTILTKAQSADDFGIWSNIEIEKKINKKWSISGELELRTKENASEIGRWGLKLGTDYNLIKEIKIGVAYQFIYLHDIEYWDFQPRHRFIGFLQGGKKWGNLELSLREKIQLTTKDDSGRIKASGKTDSYKINPECTWRNRIKASYNIPKCKLAPSFSIETFYQLNNRDGNEFDGLRYTLSLAYKLNKKQAFDLSGIYDKEVNVKNPVNSYILSIGYSYNF